MQASPFSSGNLNWIEIEEIVHHSSIIDDFVYTVWTDRINGPPYLYVFPPTYVF